MADSEGAPSKTVGAEQGLSVDVKPLFRKLKPGPGLPADQVLADQRRRLQEAMIVSVGTAGWGGVKVRSLVRAAGVSTATFYKHFLNAEDCLAATYDAAIATAVDHAAAGQSRQADWRRSLRTAVTILMEDLAGEPRVARLALLDIFAAGPTARRRIGRAVAEFEGLIAGSFAGAPRSVAAPRHLVAGMTAGMLHVARTTTIAGRCDELPVLAEQLSDWMLALPRPEVLSLPAAADGTTIWRSRRERAPFPADEGPGRVAPIGGERQRLLRAAAKLVAAEGVAGLTVPKLRAEAGVSRRSFEAHFAGTDECFLASVELITGEAADAATGWSANAAGWERRTCRFILALCAQAARNRTMARLIFQGILAPGKTGLLTRERMIDRTATALRATVPADQRPSAIATEASVAAAWHIAQSDIAAGRTRSLPSVAPLLSYVVLAPIVGSVAATEAIRAEAGTPPVR